MTAKLVAAPMEVEMDVAHFPTSVTNSVPQDGAILKQDEKEECAPTGLLAPGSNAECDILENSTAVIKLSSSKPFGGDENSADTSQEDGGDALNTTNASSRSDESPLLLSVVEPPESLESTNPDPSAPLESLNYLNYDDVQPVDHFDAYDGSTTVVSTLDEEEEIKIVAALYDKNRKFIVAFKSSQETVTVPTAGGGDEKRLFTIIPSKSISFYLHPINSFLPAANKFSKVKGKHYGRNTNSRVSRHYYCKDFFGDQNIQRYISIEFHAYVVNRYRRKKIFDDFD